MTSLIPDIFHREPIFGVIFPACFEQGTLLDFSDGSHSQLAKITRGEREDDEGGAAGNSEGSRNRYR